MSFSFRFLERHHRANQRKSLVALAFLGGLTAYIIYHIFYGNRGVFSMWKLQSIVQEEQDILTKLEQETEIKTRQVQRLRPQSLDLEFLEKRVRSVLNWAAPDEIIIMNPDSPHTEPFVVSSKRLQTDSDQQKKKDAP